MLIAVADIGKTNAKLILVDTDSGRVTHRCEQPTRSLSEAGLRQLDVRTIERWLIASPANAPGKERIVALVPIAHGAAAVLVDADNAPLVARDYEDPSFDSVAEEYRPLRDPFAHTLSPWLPLGLNLGRQLYYLQTRHASLWQRARWILPYPQYWAARFSSQPASEVTSLGCHTDLWRPQRASYSDLAVRSGWHERFAPLRRAADTLGPLSAEFAVRTGLSSTCRVHCGIHDSNASYLSHLLAHDRSPRLAVISSGTWTVILCRGGALERLQEQRDMLANVDAFGDPVATARFMGGREYQAIAGNASASADVSALTAVMRHGALAMPSFAPGGPFNGQAGRLLDAETLGTTERHALATLYVALMTDLMLDELGAGDDIVIDGPLATNALFGRILATLRANAQVLVGDARSASCIAARYLATGVTPSAAPSQPIARLEVDLHAYRERWRAQLPRS